MGAELSAIVDFGGVVSVENENLFGETFSVVSGADSEGEEKVITSELSDDDSVLESSTELMAHFALNQ